jgi:hypothetical protein
VTTFVRFRSPVADARGRYVGLFGLVNGLARDGRLSGADAALRRTRNDWFDAAYADPSTVDPSVYAANPLAAAWFKASAAHLVEACAEYCELLDRYEIAWRRDVSTDPGRIVYEDEHQIVAVPHRGPRSGR